MTEPGLRPRVDLSIIRLVDGVFAAPPGVTGRTLLLNNATGQYVAVPQRAFAALLVLQQAERGLTVQEFTSVAPQVSVAGLKRLGLVSVIPPDGLRVSPGLVAEFASQNLFEQIRFRRLGWAVVAREMKRSGGEARPSRPLVLDELEAAARFSFAIPGTDRLCTVVALTMVRMLRRRDWPAQLVVTSTSDQPYIHATAMCHGHRCDPSDDLIESPVLRALDDSEESW